MYLYFDSNGNLKEFINDPIREGSQNVNKIYVYVEPSVNKTKEVTIDGKTQTVFAFLPLYTAGTIDYKLDDNEVTTDGFAIDHSHELVYEQIPFDNKRDLKYFKYFNYYEFLKLSIPSEVTSGSGRVDATVNLTDPSDSATIQLIFPLDIFNFMVQDSAIIKNIPITRAEYSYLLSLIGKLADYVPFDGANQNIVPANNESIDLGSSSKGFKNAYVKNLLASTGISTPGYLEASNNSAYINIFCDTGGEFKLYCTDGDHDSTYYLSITSSGNHYIATEEWVDSHYLPFNENIDLGQYSLTASQLITSSISLDLGGTISVQDSGSGRDIVIEADDGKLIYDNEEVATTGQLSQKRVIGSFNTSSFAKQGLDNFYSISNVALNLNGGFITNSDLLIITWGNCFAICPIPASGAGRICAALWNANGESQITRIRYELKFDNTLIDISIAGGFTPPSNFTAYIQCIKL